MNRLDQTLLDDQGLPMQSETDIDADFSRSALVSRVILFQFKLFADGVRDLLLSPLSIAAGLIGILFAPNNPHYLFDRLLSVGRRTERWINLFDQYGEEKRDGAARREPTDDHTMDDLAHRLEDAIRRDYASDGITAKTARTFETVLAELKKRHQR